MSFAAIAKRLGRAPSGSRYSLISIVFGLICAILFVPNSQYQGLPFESIRIPYGRERAVGDCFSVTCPVFGSSFPTKLPCWTVNHKIPLESKIGVCGSLAAGSGIG